MNKLSILLLAFIGLCVLSDVDAHWGGRWGGHWGGRWGFGGRFGWGGMGLGLGYYGYPGLWGYGAYYGGYPGYLGYPYYVRRAVVESRPRVECNYFGSRSVLSCSSPNGTVECEAFGLFEKSGQSGAFNFFAVSAVPSTKDFSRPELVRYSLFPEGLDGKSWLNGSAVVDPVSGKSSRYSVYFGEESDKGFRVKDKVCYGRLVDLFSQLGANETIIVGSPSEKPVQVDVLGGILLA